MQQGVHISRIDTPHRSIQTLSLSLYGDDAKLLVIISL